MTANHTKNQNRPCAKVAQETKPSTAVFPNLWPHGQNGPWQMSGGPQKFYHFYWATGLVYGPQLIEWSIELLLTTRS